MDSRKRKRTTEGHLVKEFRLELDRSGARALTAYFTRNQLLEGSICHQHHSSNNRISDDTTRGPSHGRGGRDDPPPASSDAVTFNDIGGLSEEINFVQRSVLYPLAHKNEFSKWGFIPPKGIIFHGGPGTGKTLLAKAIAHELSSNLKTKVKFIYRKGADSHGKYFGQSSENLRKIFQEAQKSKPALIFFDEIDGLCPDRNASSATSEVYSSVVTTFLGMMDSIKPGEIFVIAATNRLDSLDPALRRPGRFDKELLFKSPDENGRKAILKVHTKKWNRKIQPSEKLIAEIAAATPGYTGAYLENLCAQAVDRAVQNYKMSKQIRVMNEDHLNNVVIEKNDWFTALKQIGHPKINSFCKILYVPQQVESDVKPLIASQIDGIKRKIIKLAAFEENCSKMKISSMLIYGENSVPSTYVVPQLFNDKEFQKMTIYQMTNDYVNRGSFCKTRVVKIMNQVTTCNKPCILYMENVDILLRNLSYSDRESDLPFLINQLRRTLNRPVLILGTSRFAPCNFPEEAWEIFPALKSESGYKMRVPNADERREFFRTVLDKKTFGGSTAADKEWDRFFQDQLETSVEITADDPMEYLIDMYSTLLTVGEKQQFHDSNSATSVMQQKQAFKASITNVIENYRIFI